MNNKRFKLFVQKDGKKHQIGDGHYIGDGMVMVDLYGKGSYNYIIPPGQEFKLDHATYGPVTIEMDT